MASCPDCTVRVGFLVLPATVPAFVIAAVHVFVAEAPEEIEGFTLNDSTNFEKSAGRWFRIGLFQSGWKLDVFIYDLKLLRSPRTPSRRSCEPNSSASGPMHFSPSRAGKRAGYLRRNFTIDDAVKRTRSNARRFT